MHRRRLFLTRVLAAAFIVTAGLTRAIHAQAPPVTREPLAGVTNFARVETTVACAGATRPEAMADIKRLGFSSVINLRLSSETGADVEGESAAARTAGLRYVHLPLNGASPDPAVADQFLAAIADPANQPAFIHCASGNRAAAMWMIKRVQIDHWDVPKAGEEAAALGLTSAPLKEFVLEYLRTHGT